MARYGIESRRLYPRLFWAQIALAVTHAISRPKTGSGCRATPFKYPKLWIQPPRFTTVQGHINYSSYW